MYPAFPPYVRYDAEDAVLAKLFAQWLPGWGLCDRLSYQLPEMFAGNVSTPNWGWWRYSLRDASGIPCERVIAARAGYRTAAAVALVVEEYLRSERDPPPEVAAAATLCWAADLVRHSPGKRRSA